MVSDVFAGRTPEGGQQFLHLPLIKTLARWENTSADFRTTCEMLVEYKETHIRVRDEELMTSSFGVENETCVITALFEHDIKGKVRVWEGFVTKLPHSILVLSTRETDEDRTPSEFIILLVPGLRRRLGR